MKRQRIPARDGRREPPTQPHRLVLCTAVPDVGDASSRPATQIHNLICNKHRATVRARESNILTKGRSLQPHPPQLIPTVLIGRPEMKCPTMPFACLQPRESPHLHKAWPPSQQTTSPTRHCTGGRARQVSSNSSWCVARPRSSVLGEVLMGRKTRAPRASCESGRSTNIDAGLAEYRSITLSSSAWLTSYSSSFPCDRRRLQSLLAGLGPKHSLLNCDMLTQTV